MNDKSNIAIVISLVAFFISLYSLTSKSGNEDFFTKSPNKTYISPDPAAKRNIGDIEKNMRENPFTPTMDGSSKLPKTNIKFASDLHEFGNVDVNSENKYSFTFKNSGNEPLKISNAKGSCGCTVPNWPKEPILPGESGEIEVVFRPSKGQAELNGSPSKALVTCFIFIGDKCIQLK